MNSLAGKILRVDLTSGEVRTEPSSRYATRWMSGRTVATWMLLDETSPDAQWSDPATPLIFSSGCLVGTASPGGCRLSIDTINAFNNGKGSANCGGHLAAELKYAGFDQVVVTGKAARPVYMWIHDGEAEIRDAVGIWGKTTGQTEEAIQKELADGGIEMAAIGPAGENLVKAAAVVTNLGQVAGGSGVGCVMGSKNLKALAVRGSGSIRVADPKRFLGASGAHLQSMVGSGRISRDRSPVIKAVTELARHPSLVAPVRNGQDEFWPAEKMQRLLGEHSGIPKYYASRMGCFGCPLGCQPFFRIHDGPFKGTSGFTYWFNTIGYSKRMDCDDPAVSVKHNLLANQLGLDGDNTVSATSWAFECYEKGLLTREDTGGLELKWGDGEAWLKLVEMIAHRRGIGNMLADGTVSGSRRLGQGSDRFVTHCKGQDSYEGFRANWRAWALGVATSPVAGRHLRGAAGAYTSGAHAGELDNDPAGALFWQLKAKEIDDMTGTCISCGASRTANPAELQAIADIVNPAMGAQLSGEELARFGLMSYNLEKAFNTLHCGFSRRDDYPPRRYMEEAIKTGPNAGKKVEKSQWDSMLDRFYELLGWDRATGWQTRRSLAALGLEDVADKLSAAGRLPEAGR